MCVQRIKRFKMVMQLLLVELTWNDRMNNPVLKLLLIVTFFKISIWNLNVLTLSYLVTGITTSHLEYFQNVRSARLQRFSVPVNQLLIRLDKLLDNMPRDTAKKKGLFQYLVYTVLYRV